MTPDSWLASELGQEYFSGNLIHLKEIIKNLELTPTVKKLITIGGTNGKGQTARLLASMFGQVNSSYALWTSPHLTSVTERMVIGGKQIEAAVLIECFQDLKNLLGEEFKNVSYFEFIFLSFLNYLKKYPVDYLILEVGLGGRLDAANSLDCDIAAVVSISREHQRLLGSTYKKILFEKLPIARSSKPLVTTFELSYLHHLTASYTEKYSIEWEDLFISKIIKKSDDFATRNFALAEKLFSLATNKTNMLKELRGSLSKRKTLEFNSLLLDLYPTHNLDGFRKLFQFLNQQQYNNYDYLLISFSDREWKDLLDICRLIKTNFDEARVKLVSFNHIKAIKKSQLEKLASEFKFDIVEPEKFLKNTDGISNKILVTGSNYFLGDLLQQIPGQQ